MKPEKGESGIPTIVQHFFEQVKTHVKPEDLRKIVVAGSVLQYPIVAYADMDVFIRAKTVFEAQGVLAQILSNYAPHVIESLHPMYKEGALMLAHSRFEDTPVQFIWIKPQLCQTLLAGFDIMQHARAVRTKDNSNELILYTHPDFALTSSLLRINVSAITSPGRTLARAVKYTARYGSRLELASWIGLSVLLDKDMNLLSSPLPHPGYVDDIPF